MSGHVRAVSTWSSVVLDILCLGRFVQRSEVLQISASFNLVPLGDDPALALGSLE